MTAFTTTPLINRLKQNRCPFLVLLCPFVLPTPLHGPQKERVRKRGKGKRQRDGKIEGQAGTGTGDGGFPWEGWEGGRTMHSPTPSSPPNLTSPPPCFPSSRSPSSKLKSHDPTEASASTSSSFSLSLLPPLTVSSSSSPCR